MAVTLISHRGVTAYRVDVGGCHSPPPIPILGCPAPLPQCWSPHYCLGGCSTHGEGLGTHLQPRGLAGPSCSLFPWNHVLPGAGHGPSIASRCCGWHPDLFRAAFGKPSESQEPLHRRHPLDSSVPRPLPGAVRPPRVQLPWHRLRLSGGPGTGWWCQRRAVASHRVPRAQLRSLSLPLLCHRSHPALPQHSQLGNRRAADSESQTAGGVWQTHPQTAPGTRGQEQSALFPWAAGKGAPGRRAWHPGRQAGHFGDLLAAWHLPAGHIPLGRSQIAAGLSGLPRPSGRMCRLAVLSNLPGTGQRWKLVFCV